VEHIGMSPVEFEEYRSQTTALDQMAEYHSMWFILLGHGEPERVQTGVVSAHFFDMMGVQPLHGRTFREGEDQAGAEPVLLLSYKYWQKSFGGDPSVVGKDFEMNDRIHKVVGILPAIPQFPAEQDVYMPVSACPFRMRERTRTARNARIIATTIGRLKPGQPEEQAQADLKTIAGRMASANPDTYAPGRGFTASVSSLQEELTKQARPTFLILLGTTGFVLLIACANVANLMLARLIRREHEMAVRTALGASRMRLLRQLVTEATMLSVAGGLVGLLFASWGLELRALRHAPMRSASIPMFCCSHWEFL
jgi:putative ABC transport system permease protein